MFRIKHGVKTTFGDIIWDEPLSQVYETVGQCTPEIEYIVSQFDNHEHEVSLDRWCAWKSDKLNEYHYWWVTAAERPTKDRDGHG
ncbi:hypothetical protein ABIC60_004192 [Phyllobacterium ifriqiyense]